MTNLTDKWKAGELPSGYYYVKNEFGNIFPSDYSEDYDYIGDTVIKDFFTEVSEIKEVLEPVPSYEEWKAKLEENTKLKTENKWYSEQLNEAVKEVAKLKELLTMVKPVLQLEYNVTENRNLIKKINQVLGE